MGHLCYLCFMFVMLSCLFIAALKSPARKGLTSWLSCMCFVTFPCCVLGQVWFLIVLISNLNLLLSISILSVYSTPLSDLLNS